MQKLLIAWLILLLSPVFVRAQATHFSGLLVVGIVGIWNDSHGTRIHFGNRLDLESEVTCEDSGGTLTLLLGTNSTPQVLHCESKGAHTSLREFAEAHSKGSVSQFFSQFWEAVTTQIGQEPKTYIAAVSRDFGIPELDEAVLPLKQDRVDVAAALASAAAGDYMISIFPIDQDTPDQTPIAVHWQPGNPALVPANGAAAGLVKIALVKDGSPTSIAWALLAPPATYPEVSKQFNKARSVVESWPGKTHAADSRSVLRAYLHSLNATAAPQP